MIAKLRTNVMTFVALVALSAGVTLAPGKASAQECIISEIRTFATNFCPRSWANTAGQLMAINSNTALFSLIGTTYGGDGRTTFGLPDLRSRSIVGGNMGAGPGLSNVTWGQRGGAETYTMSPAEMPSHTHALRGTNQVADQKRPNGDLLAFPDVSIDGTPLNIYENSNTVDATLNPLSIGNTGGNLPFPIRDPYLGMQTCICMFGIFPSRN